MCTVTFISKIKDQFVITSNRDESSARATLPPVEEFIGGHKVYFPKDQEAGGTWIASNNNGRTCCLLNGAFVKHKRQLPYAKSRGKVLLEAFQFDEIGNFFKEVDLYKVEPFTLVIADLKGSSKLFEFRWDSEKRYLKELNFNEPHIWSSAPLYSLEVQEQRREWFKEWVIKNPRLEPESIFKFHNSSHGNDPENDVVMTRSKGLETVSITQVEAENNRFKMRYFDRQANKDYHIKSE